MYDYLGLILVKLNLWACPFPPRGVSVSGGPKRVILRHTKRKEKIWKQENLFVCLFPFIFHFFSGFFSSHVFCVIVGGFFFLACVAVCAGGTSFGVTSQTFAMSQCCWMASCRKEKRTKRGNEDFLGEINVLLHYKRKNTCIVLPCSL